LILALVCAAVVTSYVFIISAGTWTTWWTWNDVYDLIAEGFRAGHLYIRYRPAPQLVAASNPLDPVYYKFWIWDASIYKDHIYYYWGPLPAVILAGYKSLFRLNFSIGDQFFVFGFFVMNLVAGALLINRMARRLFPGLPFALEILGVLVFAYTHPTPYIVATPGIYQAAIIGGQAFILSGLVFAVDAVWERSSGPPRRGLLLAAGSLWALGLATRVTVGPPVTLIILLTAFLSSRPGPARRLWLERARVAFWMGLPVAVVGVALLLYNHARFNSFFEFGTNLQMSTMRFRTSWSYVWPNVYSYLFRPSVTSCQFPYFAAPFQLGARAFPAGFNVPAGYWIAEPVAGLARAAPWIWFALVATAVGVRAVYRGLRQRVSLVSLDARQRSNAAFGAGFAIVGVVTGLPMIGQFIATMRYLVDVSSGITLFALWGAWSVYWAVRERPWPRRAVTALIVLFSLATIVIGLLYGVSGYNEMFKRHNPELYDRMRRAFSLC
jgi:hypothetical protein